MLKRLLAFAGLSTVALVAHADLFISTNENPSGSGKWYFTLPTGGGSSTQFNGFLNQWNSFPTGDLFNSPIERLGFYWRTGSSQEWILGANANDIRLSEDNDGFPYAQNPKSVTFRSNHGLGSPQIEYKLTFKLTPVSGVLKQAILDIDWEIKNTSAGVRLGDFFILGDLVSRTNSLTSKGDDNFSYANGVGTFSGTNTPTVYFLSRTEPMAFEASGQPGEASVPPVRGKLEDGAQSELADAVVGSGARNWALGFQFPIELGPNGTTSGSLALGLNILPKTVVRGNINRADYDSSLDNRAVVIEIRPVGSTSPVESHTVFPDSNGDFEFQTNRYGFWDIAAKGQHHLRQVAVNQQITASGVANLTYAVTNGDVDGDNAVTIFDYIDLSTSFDLSAGDAGYNPNADLDGDTSVTIFDYIILSNEFDKSGQD